MLVRVLLICLSAIVPHITCSIQPTEDFPHIAEMDPDGKYLLYWSFTDSDITFEIHANSTGWVGMGISPNGGMKGADIVVGWVKEGVAIVSDYHGVGLQAPELDPDQNIELLGGFESEGWTVIKYRRQLASCEPEYDLQITRDTLKIIYAFGDNDPDGNTLTSEYYHGSNRGVKSLLLLEPTKSDESVFPDGETHQSFDLLNENFHLPAETTYYNCRLHKIPEFPSKQHMVKVEPVIQPGNEMLVHHMLVYQCTDVVDESNIGLDTKCYSSNMPPDFISCQFVIQAWAIGGGAIYFPSHTGFPLGEEDSPKYVVVETHYDNPQALSDVVDSSGLRFIYTSQLRQYDAGILETGVIVNGWQHLIPPNAESYLNYGECTSQCLEQGRLAAGVKNELNVFGALLHTHLTGSQVALRHVRDGVELPYIAKDSSYDFNYQETRILAEERKILPGDDLQVVCNYKTKGSRTEMTVGGLESEKEMCMVFVYYYPKIPVTFCMTGPRFLNLLYYFGIEGAETTSTEPWGIYNDINDFLITAPEDIANQTMAEYLNAMTWDEEAVDKMSEDMKVMRRQQMCMGLKEFPGAEDFIPALVVEEPYVEEEIQCNITTSPSTTIGEVITPPVTTTASIEPTERPPTEEYPHFSVMDPDRKYILYWKFNETHITFEMHAQTIGWVGMGISPNGAMTGADIVLGWVKGEKTILSDYHGVGNEPPEMDPDQNIELLAGYETDGWTLIKYRRQLASCEPINDLPITSETLRIIFAFGDNDPDGNTLTSEYYHGSNRGVKSLLLLEPTKSDESVFPDGETHESFDLLNENFHVPAEKTYYNCRMHKIPEFSSKQHLVKIEPVIQPGHEQYVHHILVFQCSGDKEEGNIGKNTKCYMADMPSDFQNCGFVIQAWAIGGGAIYYPSHTGFPLGEDDSPKYVVVETHYDNPKALSDIVDSSGLRFVYTDQLREYDAAIITTGVTVSGVQHIIPPNAESFLSYGECSSQCLERGMQLGRTGKMNVFGAALHSHLLGTGMTLRQFRDGVELPYLFKDSSYDFNYQETRMLKEEREILPGDSLQVVCNYKSNGDRSSITMGGLRIEEEMCVVFFYYYPKMPVTICDTAPEANDLLTYFGIESAELTSPQTLYTNLNDFVITAPPELFNITIADHLNSMTWDKEKIDQFSIDMRDARRSHRCTGSRLIPAIDPIISAPVIDRPYIEEELTCSDDGIQMTTSASSVEETTSLKTTSTQPTERPPTEEYPHFSVMDPDKKYILYWKFDETHITFEMHAHTIGWVGMGISPNGAMTGADIVLGWVKGETTILSDYHGVGNEPPEIDPDQNIELLAGYETDGWTLIKYRRQLASCEPINDLPITRDTLKIIYAFGDNEPDGNTLTYEHYHGSNRGVKSLLLLEPTKSDENAFPDGETHQSFDLLNENFHLPAEKTYYNCRLHKLPEFSSKQHLVKIEPVIQPGNEQNVHHILVLQCIGRNIDEASVGQNTRCYMPDMPQDFQACWFIIQAWAIGGGAIYYPSHAGFPLGEDDSPMYVVVETHYDNPEALSDIVDSSGLRFVYTDQLREYDAAIITTGVTVSGLQHVIPPNAQSFPSYGECTSQCLEKGMENGKVDKINIFGGMLHSHLLGTEITMRHIRDGVELPYPFKDSSYDYNYQETRMLKEEREVFPGDSLQVVCNYRSNGVRSTITMGGLGVEEEMCVVFFHYYPKISMTLCDTAPDVNDIFGYFGIESAELTVPKTQYTNLYDYVITAPSKLFNMTVADYLNSMDWNNEKVDQFNIDMRDIKRVQQCIGLNFFPNVESVPAPIIDHPYVEESMTCSRSDQQTTSPIGNIEETTTGGASPMTVSVFVYTLLLAVTVAFL